MTEEKYGKIIVATVLKTILFVIGFLSLAVSYVFMISPETISNVYSKLGMKNAEIAAYERLYEKSGKNADLFNLIQKYLAHDEYSNAKDGILKLQKTSAYSTFATDVNNASIAAANKYEVAYVVDLDSYLMGQLLVCEYRLGNKEKAKQMAIDDFDNTSNEYSFLFGNYYDEVLTDLSLTVAAGQTLLMDIYSGDGVAEKIDAKINALDYEAETNEKLKIAKLYTKIKIMNYKRNIMNFKGENIDTISANINSLKVTYDNLCK